MTATRKVKPFSPALVLLFIAGAGTVRAQGASSQDTLANISVASTPSGQFVLDDSVIGQTPGRYGSGQEPTRSRSSGMGT